MSDFASILDKPATEIDRPKPLPVGEYVWMIQGLPKFDKSREKQTPYVEFNVKCVGATESVDEEALNEWAAKADGTMRSLTDYATRLTFYITPDSTYRLQEFMVNDLKLDGTDKTTRQLIDETPNTQFIGSIVHTASRDGESIFANIGKTAPVED